MSKVRFAAVASVVAAICSFTPMAYAQATRTWVSGVGDDANPCSRTAPCKTFAGAISKTAVGGEIDTLDPGGFGAVTITKSIIIDGTSGIAGVLVSGTNAFVVAGAGINVILRNLDINGINGAGVNGINITQAADVRVENCKIYAFSQRGINDTRTSGKLFVTNTVINNNGNSAIVVLPASTTSLAVTIDNVKMDSNGNSGLVLTQGAQGAVTRSEATGNAQHGFYADGGSVLNLEDCVSFLNGIGVTSAATVRLSNVTVTGNGTGLNAVGGSILSYGFNRITGNGAGNGPPTGSIPLQ